MAQAVADLRRHLRDEVRERRAEAHDDERRRVQTNPERGRAAAGDGPGEEERRRHGLPEERQPELGPVAPRLRVGRQELGEQGDGQVRDAAEDADEQRGPLVRVVDVARLLRVEDAYGARITIDVAGARDAAPCRGCSR